MIGYHWSPARNNESITKHGLLVPKRHPKLTEPMVCSEGHRNPHISLGKSATQAWELSGGFLVRRAKEQGLHSTFEGWWNLYEVNLGTDNGIVAMRGTKYRSNGYELQVSSDIHRSAVKYAGSRFLT